MNHGIVSLSEPRPRPLREKIFRKFWRTDAFIDTYVFPDGKLTAAHDVIAAAEGAGFEVRDVESLREHYAMTLRHWVRALEEKSLQATEMVGEHHFRIWRLYWPLRQARLRTPPSTNPDAAGEAGHAGKSNIRSPEEDLYARA